MARGILLGMTDSPYRALPGVDVLLNTSPLKEVKASSQTKGEAAREVISDARATIAEGGSAPSLSLLAEDARDRLEAPAVRGVQHLRLYHALRIGDRYSDKRPDMQQSPRL